MALFKKTAKTDEQVADAPAKPEVKKAAASRAKTPSMGADLAHVLLHPRITEKATDQAANNAYVFDVAVSANKKQIAEAVRRLYKVTPIKVRVAMVPAKQVRHARTGIKGMTASGKKAYVYLKAGESISVM